MNEITPKHRVAFQGEYGAYSDLAARAVFPHDETLPCRTFEEAFAAVKRSEASRAILPVENSVAGRVAEIHQLLPHSGLYIIAEYFLRINHCLLVPPGASLASIKRVHSHPQALQQCRGYLTKNGYAAVAELDTAGSAAMVARLNSPEDAAIASSLAGEIYGLQLLKTELEDATHNTTRFLVLSPEREIPELLDGSQQPCITSFVFKVRHVPAALYKALGGFATNGVNLSKLESYMVDGRFVAAQFYADCEGHIEQPSLRLAFEELGFYTSEIHILGTYPSHPFRRK